MGFVHSTQRRHTFGYYTTKFSVYSQTELAATYVHWCSSDLEGFALFYAGKGIIRGLQRSVKITKLSIAECNELGYVGTHERTSFISFK